MIAGLAAQAEESAVEEKVDEVAEAADSVEAAKVEELPEADGAESEDDFDPSAMIAGLAAQAEESAESENAKEESEPPKDTPEGEEPDPTLAVRGEPDPAETAMKDQPESPPDEPVKNVSDAIQAVLNEEEDDGIPTKKVVDEDVAEELPDEVTPEASEEEKANQAKMQNIFAQVGMGAMPTIKKAEPKSEVAGTSVEKKEEEPENPPETKEEDALPEPEMKEDLPEDDDDIGGFPMPDDSATEATPEFSEEEEVQAEEPIPAAQETKEPEGEPEPKGMHFLKKNLPRIVAMILGFFVIGGATGAGLVWWLRSQPAGDGVAVNGASMDGHAEVATMTLSAEQGHSGEHPIAKDSPANLHGDSHAVASPSLDGHAEEKHSASLSPQHPPQHLEKELPEAAEAFMEKASGNRDIWEVGVIRSRWSLKGLGHWELTAEIRAVLKENLYQRVPLEEIKARRTVSREDLHQALDASLDAFPELAQMVPEFPYRHVFQKLEQARTLYPVSLVFTVKANAQKEWHLGEGRTHPANWKVPSGVPRSRWPEDAVAMEDPSFLQALTAYQKKGESLVAQYREMLSERERSRDERYRELREKLFGTASLFEGQMTPLQVGGTPVPVRLVISESFDESQFLEGFIQTLGENPVAKRFSGFLKLDTDDSSLTGTMTLRTFKGSGPGNLPLRVPGFFRQDQSDRIELEIQGTFLQGASGGYSLRFDRPSSKASMVSGQ